MGFKIPKPKLPSIPSISNPVSIVTNAVSGVADAVSNVTSNVVNAVNNTIDNVGSFVQDVGDVLGQGFDVVTGVIEKGLGTLDQVTDVLEKAGKVMSKGVDFLDKWGVIDIVSSVPIVGPAAAGILRSKSWEIAFKLLDKTVNACQTAIGMARAIKDNPALLWGKGLPTDRELTADELFQIYADAVRGTDLDTEIAEAMIDAIRDCRTIAEFEAALENFCANLNQVVVGIYNDEDLELDLDYMNLDDSPALGIPPLVSWSPSYLFTDDVKQVSYATGAVVSGDNSGSGGALAAGLGLAALLLLRR